MRKRRKKCIRQDYLSLAMQKLKKLVPSCSTSFFQLNAHVFMIIFTNLLWVQLFKPNMNCWLASNKKIFTYCENCVWIGVVKTSPHMNTTFSPLHVHGLSRFPEWLCRLHGAGQEHLGAEAHPPTARGCPHKDEEVAVDAEQPLDGLRHVQVGEPGSDLQLEKVAPQVAAQEALHLLHILACPSRPTSCSLVWRLPRQ